MFKLILVSADAPKLPFARQIEQIASPANPGSEIDYFGRCACCIKLFSLILNSNGSR
jgi:hypothetical protein